MHIAAGVVALVSMWIPLLSRKGGQVHRRGGRLYACAMAVVVAGALVACGIRLGRGASGPELHQTSFLALLAVLAGENVWYRVRSLRRKSNNGVSRAPVDVAPTVLLLIVGLGGVVWGLPDGAILFVVFGALSTVLGVVHVRTLLRGTRERRAWLLDHLGNMIGACIATVTAVAVVNYAYAPDAVRAVIPSVAVWLLPAAVGVPVIIVWARRYRVER